MNQYDYNETEIDIVELLWKLLDSWKVLLIAGLLGVLLMLGYRQLNVKEESEQQVTTIDDAKERLSASEIGMVHAVYDKTRNIDSLAVFLGSSYLMRVDPFNVEKVALIYQINSDDLVTDKERLEWNVSEAKTLYSNYLSSVEFEDSLAEKLGLESGRALSGLVELEEANSDITLNFNKNYSMSTIERNSNTSKNSLLPISVIVPEEFDKATFVDCVMDCIDDYTDNGSFGIKIDRPYTIHYAYELSEFGYSEDVYRTQTALQNLIYSENVELDNLKKKLSDDAKKYLDILVNKDNGLKVTKQKVSIISLKDIVTGFALGTILACTIVCANIIFSPKASRIMGYGALMSSPIIPCHLNNKERNIFFTSNLVRKLRSKRVKGVAKEVDVASSALAYYVREVNAENVSIVSLQLSEEPDDKNAIYINAIKDKSGISSPVIILCVKDIENVDFYEKLEAANDNIVFALESGDIGLETLNKLAFLIRVKGKRILGTIVFDN